MANRCEENRKKNMGLKMSPRVCEKTFLKLQKDPSRYTYKELIEAGIELQRD